MYFYSAKYLDGESGNEGNKKYPGVVSASPKNDM
jgi:hypothetical protein